jgi:hypothetical protein
LASPAAVRACPPPALLLAASAKVQSWSRPGLPGPSRPTVSGTGFLAQLAARRAWYPKGPGPGFNPDFTQTREMKKARNVRYVPREI